MTNRKKIIEKCTTANERFGVIGGVCPPESLCVFASSPPASAFVSRQPRQAATTLGASGRQSGGKATRSQNVRSRNLTEYKVNC